MEFFESPRLVRIGKPQLEDNEWNRARGKELLEASKETIEETNDYILFRTGDIVAGKGYIIQLSKKDGRIHYYVEYENENRKITGKTFTQVMLWRNKASAIAQGKTKEVFFDYLIKKNKKAILSDREQTENGRDFWISRMGWAVENGYKVGFVHMNTNIDWFGSKPAETFEEWLERTDGWTKSVNGIYNRYFITS